MIKETINSHEIIKYATSKSKISIVDKIINCDYLEFPIYENVSFTRCDFIGKQLFFNDSEQHIFKRITLNKCNIKIDISCYFHELDQIIVRNSCWEGELEICGKIKHFRLGKINVNRNFKFDLNIEDTTLNHCFLESIESTGKFNLISCQINNNFFFENSNFLSENIKHTTFEESYFQNKIQSKMTSVLLEYCQFKKSFYFQNNKVCNLNIGNCQFNKETSIQNLETNILKIKHSFFEKTILFDELNILSINDCDRKTIRIIKQELQKTENRIDYDKYRSYELELYKKELKEKEKWWHGDLLILRLNSLFSNHGLSWKKAIGMTFLFSLLFYTLLYGVERFYNKFTITEISFDHYTSGYFKFFLVTNFYDPLSEDKKYLSHFLEWFFFILGKSTIGYGLFETVQSFRKYPLCI